MKTRDAYASKKVEAQNKQKIFFSYFYSLRFVERNQFLSLQNLKQTKKRNFCFENEKWENIYD
jgi:hypothetical protein